jgi:DNA modification methylase
MCDNLDELRNIEGFPLSEDEDLHALSNPPYYTAYPNPHLAEFIKEFGTPFDEVTDNYHRQPFVSDVSEGKNDPIYNAHTYHTKVPYKAIIPFIEHYTEPGDTIFDGFCGTGMTGVAAQMANRKAILCDLSPIATFIAYNYNKKLDLETFEREAKRIVQEVKAECGWMYETKHIDGRAGRINYTVWSDVFVCPYCSSDVVFWEAAVNHKSGSVLKEFLCPTCKAKLTKRDLQRAPQKDVKNTEKEAIHRYLQVPVLINYSVSNKRYEKKPDALDLATISKIEQSEIPYWSPSYRMMHLPENKVVWGDEWRAGRDFIYIQELHSKRNAWCLAALLDRIWRLKQDVRYTLYFSLTGIITNASRMYRWRSNRKGGTVSGTYYLPSTPQELNVLLGFEGKYMSVAKAFRDQKFTGTNPFIITTQSSTNLKNIPENFADYIFTDPPFGDNLMYSELNFLLEAWLRIFTNNKSEAIINKTQGKGLDQYRDLMTKCFSEMYRLLKPNRWITVVFHNSKAAVWNAIQESLSKAGFIVAQVTIMDKQQGSFKQVTSPGTVKNDLVINAYKPTTVFKKRFVAQAGDGLESMFILEHLHQLPVAANIERSKEMLYSKYLAYYVQHGYQVKFNSDQYYSVLPKWGLVERDGYWFMDESQAQQYELGKVRQISGRGKQPPAGQQILFISDEKSARQWLWDFLGEPKYYDEIYTAFVKALQTSQDQIPELKEMLEESFVRTNGDWKRPDAFTQAELDKRRQERLLRQFNEYLDKTKAGQRLKEVRLETLVVGFTECYRQNRFEDILAVGRKLDRRLLEESADLFDFVDIARRN